MAAHRILIVDDERSIREMLRMTLEYEGFVCDEAESGLKGLECMATCLPDAVILDVKMSGIDGIETLERMRAAYPEVPVVLLTGHGSIETAVEATKKGAFDFLGKPPDREKILITLRNAIRQTALLRENRRMREELQGPDEMIGASPPIRALRETIHRIAPTEAYVLVTGENGTGKELVARAIHRGSSRAGKDMIEVNCAAIPHDLIESELFGHEKGSFTGASAQRIGKFEQADGGTLFLDEIGDMSPSAQAKVLRVLEEGTFERVGGNGRIAVDVRVIAATNKDLAAEIRDGRFREDLFHRLNVLPIHVPPLRERREDIPSLVHFFLSEASRKNKLPLRRIDEEAMHRLQAMRWPGNVRELRNAVERLAIMAAEVVTASDVATYVFGSGDATATELPMDVSFEAFKDLTEEMFLRRQLERFEWNVSRTADELGMQRSHLYKKINKYGLERKE
ncbi:MAG: sigma-54 dependent transcriptional regulator [Bacteroidota bacterium]|jgi:DNA-binding NtrC family response regulator|nr:sigma-54 dependent transcriptional regulator [Bacteroidota bacterium]